MASLPYISKLPVRRRRTAGSFNIETGDPPAGWGVRRTISNKEFRTAEVFERNKTIFFTSIFCGSLFCGSAVHILKAKSFGHKFFIYNQPRYHERKALEYCKKS